MKKMTRNSFKSLVFSLLASSFLLFSCMNDIDSASTTAGLDNSGDDSVVLNDNDGTSDKTSRKDLGGSSSVIDFGDDFIRGFDASAVDYDEELNSSLTWQNTDGTTMDFFKVLALNGVNTVRLRLWVDPSNAPVENDDYWPSTGTKDLQRAGDNTLARYIKLAKRAKKQGLKVMLDFHYSDYWTDPACQLIPADWQSITTADAVAEKLGEYTSEVLKTLEKNGILPEYVQIGNEIDNGMLLHTKKNGDTKTSADSSVAGSGTNLYAYLKAASAAVRENAPDAKIIIHGTHRSVGVNMIKACITNGVDFDIAGLSFYPWEGHGTTTELIESIKTLKDLGKGVMVVETSTHWNGDVSDSTTKTYLTRIKDHLLDNSLETPATYENLTLDDTKAYVLPTLENSQHATEDIMQTVHDAGGIGVCTWGGERREDWKYAMFDWNGKAMSNIKAFSYDFSTGSTSGSVDNTGGGY